jgi:polyisoprenoid-binding protein YceI
VATRARKVIPLEKEHVGFVARGLLSRSTFGVAVGVPADLLSDDIEIEIAAQLVAAEEQG